MKTALKVVTLCFLPLCLLAIWQLGSTSGRWSSYILPSPMEVYSALLTLLTSKELQEHIWISLQRVIFGFLLACGAALPLSLMLGMSHRARILLQPVLEFFRHIPPLALLPLIILWFGIGEKSKLAVVFMATFYPIFVNSLRGLMESDQKALEMSKHYGIRPLKEFLHLRLPYAAPFLYTGFRLGLGYSWRSLIGAEMIAASSGLGYLILDAQAMARPDIVLVGVFSIGLSGMIMDILFCRIATSCFARYLQGEKGGRYGLS